MGRISMFDCFEGEPKTSLKECLQLYWGYRLLELAQIHGLQVDEGTSDSDIIEQLIPKMLDNFPSDVEYLNETEWLFLNKVKQNPNEEMNDIEKKQYATLKWLGYVYLFNHNGHIYPVIPKDLLNLLPQSYSEEFERRVEHKQKLFTYTLALVNLYGVYRIEQLVDVWNMYNKEKVTVEEAQKYVNEIDKRQGYFWYNKGYIVSNLIENEIQYLALLKNSYRCPYFLPTKSDIAFYSDIEQLLSSSYIKKIEEFIGSKDNLDENEKEDLLYDIFGVFQLDLSLEVVIDMLKDMGIEFNDEDETEEFMRLLRVASDNTRKWGLRGHMPVELGKSRAKVPIDRPQLQKPQPRTVKKIGRNDPCYCGSGKKYKHCCGKI
ncbi:MAG TPA: SEC-C metal-binding domain-containing protein [Acetivibrio clariflavus]|nr:SEC-C metal-binding domain-containing protein [Acetivibrio clariflavus]HPU41927.1 SEC-C metal-binding domain-containing protein [Acetivibrio clariflavus]